MLSIFTHLSALNETNMYIVWLESNRYAVLIDPSDGNAAMRYLTDHDLYLEYIFLTHEHYDHIAALDELRNKTGAPVVASQCCSNRIQNKRHNLSNVMDMVIAFKKEKYPEKNITFGHIDAYEAKEADIVFEGSLELNWHGHMIKMEESPGHSKGSTLINFDGEILFSGDTVTYDYELVTGFPGGSKRDYESITKPIIESLPQEMKVYPGHGRAFTLGEAICANNSYR